MDLKLDWNGRFFDLVMENNDLAMDASLQSAVAISLFTDRRVTAEELPDGETDKRGWWGDALPDIDGDQIGSRLWLLAREKQTEEVRRRAVEYAKESLEWMIVDGVAQSVEVIGEWVGSGFLGLAVTVQRPTGKLVFKYKVNWNAQATRGEDGL